MASKQFDFTQRLAEIKSQLIDDVIEYTIKDFLNDCRMQSAEMESVELYERIIANLEARKHK